MAAFDKSMNRVPDTPPLASESEYATVNFQYIFFSVFPILPKF